MWYLWSPPQSLPRIPTHRSKEHHGDFGFDLKKCVNLSCSHANTWKNRANLQMSAFWFEIHVKNRQFRNSINQNNGSSRILRNRCRWYRCKNGYCPCRHGSNQQFSKLRYRYLERIKPLFRAFGWCHCLAIVSTQECKENRNRPTGYFDQRSPNLGGDHGYSWDWWFPPWSTC